ncbi:mechanosensitive ion channel domain-containing protein [Tundrisphaera sp. TA3]|uniref:mechanosensitive ion channel domain-containing protein n=1 Tax=Tundrisphaera sp. TA3 TaxID=3435775 RepID=UPI003EBD879D
MRYPRRLALGLLSAAIWPGYVAVLGFAAYAAPWPRNVAWPLSVTLLFASFSLFFIILGWMATGPGGWAEVSFQAPPRAIRQGRRVMMTLPVAFMLFLLPTFLAHQGLIAPEERPVSAVALCRLLVLAFELTCWVLAYRLLRRTSPILQWLISDPEWSGWIGRHHLSITRSILVGLAIVIGLDAAGYRYSAQRLTFGWGGSLIVALLCWGLYTLLVRFIGGHAWRWTKATPPSATTAGVVPGDATAEVDDPAARFRTLARYSVAFLGMFAVALIWNVDMALFSYLGEQKLWGPPTERGVTLGDFTQMVLILFATGFAWRHLNACFTMIVFPRLPDDPGIRYAVVTLCRYVVLGVGLLTGLSSVQLGLERIGVVVAALGVGLGFGLQEIVSNFVSGIILLLERPIRVGDVVTVGGMSGKVDRINIRATTIINGENQSIIIPNRQFITGNLVNWTHKDKIIRVQVDVSVAHGTDPDKVTDLLLAIAQEDADILNNPVPSALLDSFGESTMNFKLWAHVPDPSLMGRVRHRLFGQIQKRFAASGIVIPLPTRELRVHSIEEAAAAHPIARPHIRPPESPVSSAHSPWTGRMPLPVPAESCYRGVDE